MRSGLIGRSTTDALFIVRQLQEKFYAVNKTLCMALVDLERAFDRVPKYGVLLANWSRGIAGAAHTEHVYANARSRFLVGCNLSEEFSVKMSVHQGSCLCHLLIITVVSAPSQKFCKGCLWENLYADYFVVITESLEELQEKLIFWKTNMEGKGLRVNMGKTKDLISGLGLDVLQKSGKDPCGVCVKGVGTNSIFCGGCSSWIHK